MATNRHTSLSLGNSHTSGVLFDTNFINKIREENGLQERLNCERRVTAPVLLGSHICAAVYSLVS